MATNDAARTFAAEGATGLLSFGVSGGLSPMPKTGDMIVATDVFSDNSALACDASCGFDLSQCGPAVCAPGDTWEPATGLCTASIPSAGGIHMSVYRNYIDWSIARTLTSGTLLTGSRGSLNAVQNFDGVRSIIGRMPRWEQE